MEKIEQISSSGYTAKINLTRGANCISLRNDIHSANILREPDYTKPLDNEFIYGMPILFPPNRISDGKFEFDGRVYSFPINDTGSNSHLHGELYSKEFTLTEKTADKIVCEYTADQDNPYMDFPHNFKVEMTYTLSEDGLTQKIEIYNLSSAKMPALLGFHTTFNSVFAEGGLPENITVLAEFDEEYERNPKTYLPTGNTLSPDDVSTALLYGKFNPFTSVSKHFRAEKKQKLIIFDSKKGLSVVYEPDKKFKFRLIYNGDASGYICLEPQTCLTNCPNSPFDREYAGFDYICPNESKIYTSKIYIK